ncbi:MAG: DUF805 domain-containing protein [Thermoguttaceae bacterium]|nr:DUF805 domain-containing protein [Thermoguttaceae bacterium]
MNETNLEAANPFATPEAVAETNDGWEFADAPPTVGPSFCGAVWYCLRRPFDFKGRANRTEYFGWLAGVAVACFAGGLGLGAVDKETAPAAIMRVLAYCSLAFSLAATIPGAAVWTRRLRDRNRRANVWTALGGIVAALACGGAFYLVREVDPTNQREVYAAALVIVALGGLVSVASLAWGPSILLTGFGLGKWATIPGKEEPAFLKAAVVLVLLGLFLRVVLGVWRGTPGPNRFGGERLTPKEAARRERAQNAEDALSVENETV